MPVPVWGDDSVGALVPAVRVVLPGPELLAERGIEMDRLTLYRWVQRFDPEPTQAARPSRHCVGDQWFTGETYMKATGAWRYVYRATDQHGHVIDELIPAAFHKHLAV